MNPNIKICGSLPIYTSNIEENLEFILKGIEKKPDLIEYRFDYMYEHINLNPIFLKTLLKKSEIPTIFTFRRKSEGGHSNIDEKKRLVIVKQLIDAKPDYLDIEIENKLEFLSETVPKIFRNNIGLIFSYHNFKKTPTQEEIMNLVEKTQRIITKDLGIDSKINKNIIFKFIFMANKIDDNYKVLKLNKELSKLNQKIISFCMGDIGFVSRILCVKTGAFMTYASLNKKTAPGQISIEFLRKIYNLIMKN